jgi:L-lactate dehydrogenase complex protein LldE
MKVKVGLFIPCYIDQLYPQVGIATYQLLNNAGCDVRYPLEQTCCGQPMANAGFARITGDCNRNFIQLFKNFDYVVCPSGSCVLHLKEHLHGDDQRTAELLRHRIFELCEFLTDVLKIQSVKSVFPFRVGLHTSCHGQRGLHLSSASEISAESFSKPAHLLNMVSGVTLLRPKRWDECCGFGGTFCVTEEAVSVAMGADRVTEHEELDVDYITGADMSCLMHLEGLLNRKKSHIRVLHIAEILNHEPQKK